MWFQWLNWRKSTFYPVTAPNVSKCWPIVTSSIQEPVASNCDVTMTDCSRVVAMDAFLAYFVTPVFQHGPSLVSNKIHINQARSQHYPNLKYIPFNKWLWIQVLTSVISSHLRMLLGASPSLACNNSWICSTLGASSEMARAKKGPASLCWVYRTGTCLQDILGGNQELQQLKETLWWQKSKSQGCCLLTSLNCFTSHSGKHRTNRALWIGQGIPCFCKNAQCNGLPKRKWLLFVSRWRRTSL